MRRQHESELLDHYHQALVRQGVRDYSRDALGEDYALSILVYLGAMIGNITTLDSSNERGEAFFTLTLERSATAVMDLDALNALARTG